MKHLFIFLCVLMCSDCMWSQSMQSGDIHVRPSTGNVNPALIQTLENHVRKSIRSEYNSSSGALISVKPSIELKNKKSLEGISTYRETETVIRFKLINIITKNRTNYTRSFSVSGQNIESDIRDSLNVFFNREQGEYSQVLDFIDLFIKTEFGDNCEEILKQAEKYYARGNKKKAASVFALLQSESKCTARAGMRLEETIMELQESLCKENVNKAKILIASGDVKKGLKLLEVIHSDAPCSGEINNIVNNLIANGNKNESNVILQNIQSSSSDKSWFYRVANRWK